MASLRDIRSRINSVKNTQQVTGAMKMVAAAKLRRAQERIFKARPYAFKIAEIISHIQREADPELLEKVLVDFRDQFGTAEGALPEGEQGGVLLIVVTADRGLAGGFNSNIIKVAEQVIAEQYAEAREQGRLYLLCVGRKGHDHFAKRGYQLVGTFRGVFDALGFALAQDVVEAAVRGYLEGRWGEVKVVYNEFKNTISQNRIVEPLLPIPAEQFITPVMEREIEHQAEFKEGYVADYIFEPDAETLLLQLLPRYMNFLMWRILLESNAAEQGARMVAMDNATSNAEELLGNLRLKYNRARQDAITKELIEITSGADALGAA